MAKYEILGVFTGKITSLSNSVQSGMIKNPVEKIYVRKHSIDSDEIANTKYHGGEMRVVHHYSLQNYQELKLKFPDISERFIPGSFGENILTQELTETDLNIGDIYSLGTAKVQLTVSRRPCATINLSYQDPRILKEVMLTGKTGWFYRVLQEGEIKPGDYLELLERPFPGMPVSRLYNQGYGKERFTDIEFLKKCLGTGLMDKGWKPKLEDAIANLPLP